MPARRSRSTMPSSTRSWRSATPTMRASLVHDEVAEQPDLRLGARRQGGDRRRVRQCRPRHQDRPGQQPAGAERDGAARRGRPLRHRRRQPTPATSPARTRTCIAWSCRRSSAWRPSTSCAWWRPTSAAASARRSSSTTRNAWSPGPRRRSAAARSNGPRDRSEAFLTDAHGRDHVSHAELAIDAQGNTLALRVNTKANIGAYMSTFSSSIPTYLYATLLAGQYKTPAIYCDVQAYYTNTVPVDAYRGAGRPEASFLLETLMDQAAHRDRDGPGRVPPPQLHRQGRLPLPDARGADVRHRQLRGDARRGAQARRLCRLPGAQGRVRAARQAARHRPVLLHRGLRHRPFGGGGLAGRRRRPVGERQGPLHPHRQGAGVHRLAQPRPGPRDDLRAGGRREAGRRLRGHRRHPWRHRQDPGRHGHLRLALAGGRRRGDRQCLQEAGRQGQEDRGAPDGGGRGRHRVQGRPVQRRRHRQVGRHRPGRLHRLRAAQLPAGRRARASRSRHSSIRRTSPTRPAATSASSRSTPRPAWSRSCASSRSTISATSSTR